uniref:Uncharacterized protein n=1 Tax=Myotis myotis TaxID=51298 RepID=A0A7J7TTM3_MYOMY|nr:hypothetical protein mMyoMyo1_008918 [Myotis myotis]
MHPQANLRSPGCPRPRVPAAQGARGPGCPQLKVPAAPQRLLSGNPGAQTRRGSVPPAPPALEGEGATSTASPPPASPSPAAAGPVTPRRVQRRSLPPAEAQRALRSQDPARSRPRPSASPAAAGTQTRCPRPPARADTWRRLRLRNQRLRLGGSARRGASRTLSLTRPWRRGLESSLFSAKKQNKRLHWQVLYLCSLDRAYMAKVSEPLKPFTAPNIQPPGSHAAERERLTPRHTSRLNQLPQSRQHMTRVPSARSCNGFTPGESVRAPSKEGTSGNAPTTGVHANLHLGRSSRYI